MGLRSQADKHIEVEGEAVQSRWKDQGAWQAMVIEKRSGSGVINSQDLICLRAHTGKHLDVVDGIVRARYDDCGDWQSMQIEKESSDAVFQAPPSLFWRIPAIALKWRTLQCRPDGPKLACGRRS